MTSSFRSYFTNTCELLSSLIILEKVPKNHYVICDNTLFYEKTVHFFQVVNEKRHIRTNP